MHASTDPKRTNSTGNARLRRYRDGKKRVDLYIDPGLLQQVQRIGETYEASQSEVIGCMLRHALTSHDWMRFGLLWRNK